VDGEPAAALAGEVGLELELRSDLRVTEPDRRRREQRHRSADHQQQLPEAVERARATISIEESRRRLR
jgi:hypothetical protein